MLAKCSGITKLNYLHQDSQQKRKKKASNTINQSKEEVAPAGW
jgi:hypothetical protein